MDEKEQVVDDQNESTEEAVQEEETAEEENQDEQPDELEELRSELEKERKAREQLTARAKKAEAALKEKSSQSVEATEQTTTNNNAPSVEETVLKAQGVDEDSLAYLKKVAQVNDIGLIEAQQDDLYLSWKDKREKEQKSQKANLGASRGSGQVRQKETLQTSGLTQDKHKELWKQQTGQ